MLVLESNTKAEYKALATTTAKLFWFLIFFKELDIFLPHKPILWCQNIGHYYDATCLYVNSAFHAYTKHIEIKFHFVRDKVASKSLGIRSLSTKGKVTNIFTKSLLVSARFSHLWCKLNVNTLPLSLRGPLRNIKKEPSQVSTNQISQSRKKLNFSSTTWINYLLRRSRDVLKYPIVIFML